MAPLEPSYYSGGFVAGTMQQTLWEMMQHAGYTRQPQYTVFTRNYSASQRSYQVELVLPSRGNNRHHDIVYGTGWTAVGAMNDAAYSATAFSVTRARSALWITALFPLDRVLVALPPTLVWNLLKGNRPPLTSIWATSLGPRRGSSRI